MLGSKGDCEKTKLSDDEQTRHYICCQRGELVFVSTEDYQLGCVMRILRYLKKAPERAPSKRILRYRLGKVPF